MAEFNLEQATLALRNAHSSGNVEDARKIASMIKQYQASQQTQTAEEAPATPATPATPARQEEDGFIKSGLKEIGKAGLGLVQGLAVDPLIGLTQLGARGIDFILPGDQSGLTRGVDKLSNVQERGYQSLRKGLGGEGFDLSRLAGTIATIPLSGGLGAGAKAAGTATKLGSKIGKKLDEGVGALSKIGKEVPKATPPTSIPKVQNLLPGAAAKPGTFQRAGEIGTFQRAGEIGGKALGNLSQLALRPISTIASKIDPRVEKFLFGPSSNKLTAAAKYGIAGAELPLAARARTTEDQERYGERFSPLNLGIGAGLGLATGPLSALTRQSTKPGALATELAKKDIGTLAQQSGNPFLQSLESGAAKYFLGGSKIGQKQREAVNTIQKELGKSYNDLYNITNRFNLDTLGVKKAVNNIESIYNSKAKWGSNPKVLKALKNAFERVDDLKYATVDASGKIIKPANLKMPATELKNVINDLRVYKEEVFKLGDKQATKAIKDLYTDLKKEAKKQFGSKWARELDKTDDLYSQFKNKFKDLFPETKADIGTALGLQGLGGAQYGGFAGALATLGLPGALNLGFYNPTVGRMIFSSPAAAYGAYGRSGLEGF